MTVDLTRLKHFSMTYVFFEDEGDMVYEYEQAAENIWFAPEGNGITFTLKNINQDEDKDIYTVAIVKEGDDDFCIMSDYFDDADEPYLLDVEISDDDVKFVLAGEDEVMYLYGFFE